jgi:hypothetical protein
MRIGNQFPGYNSRVTEGRLEMIDVDSSSAQFASSGERSMSTTHALTAGYSTNNVHVHPPCRHCPLPSHFVSAGSKINQTPPLTVYVGAHFRSLKTRFNGNIKTVEPPKLSDNRFYLTADGYRLFLVTPNSHVKYKKLRNMHTVYK